MTGTSRDPARPRSDITVTLTCNNQCRFCPRTTLRHLTLGSRDQLDDRLGAIRQHSDRVVLTGGEVTQLDDVVAIVARCRALGFEQIGVITNGRRLSDPQLAGDLVAAGLTEACVTVYDVRPVIHDHLTATPGSLAETLAGLDNLLALARAQGSLLVRINTLLCPSNADGMVATVQDLTDRGVGQFLIGDPMLSDFFSEALDHQHVVAVARAIAEDPRLEHCKVLWRGFPPCLFTPVPGVVAEPHDIDTAIVDELDLNAYFAEFFRNFIHLATCDQCANMDRCPGLQKRYLAQHDPTHIVPLQVPSRRPVAESVKDDETALVTARRELGEFPPWSESGRLEVIPTTACPFRCRYCAVKLGQSEARPEMLDRGVDLLLSSRHQQLELQFFGGEPLLRASEVMRTMRRGAALAASQGKSLKFVITTSGLPLDAELLTFLRDFDSKVMFSFDGPADVMARYRPLARSTTETSRVLERKLSQLIQSGVDYFVNLVVTPDGAADLPRRVSYVAGLGARHIQVCYALSPGWTDEAQAQYCESLRHCAALAERSKGPRFRLQNLGSAAEPTVLSNDIIMDVDGTLYDDAALFGEVLLPGLRSVFRLGHVAQIDSFDGLRPTREQNLVALRRAYPDEQGPERRLVEEQLDLARRIQQTLDEIGTPAVRQQDHNPLQDRVLRRPLSHQAKVLERQPALLTLPMLMLENPCTHDCLFCLAKPLEPTPLAQVVTWLGENRQVGLTRLGLAGNEPLGHPDIDAILSEARACGFTRFDVLTSGTALRDPDRARALVDGGVRGYGLPLYAADPKIHDGITQSPGSYAATREAIDTLQSLGAEVHVHANLLRHNLPSLGALEQLVTGELGLPLCVIPIRPKAANRPYLELVPRYADIVVQAEVSCLVGFPLCIASQVQEPAIPSGTIISDVLKVYVLDQPFVKPPKCHHCRWVERCSGTFGPYLDRYGDDELIPQAAPASRSH
ncbi:MAG: hypothetical protein DRI90_00275 [Deltaproteobacteria bacterium]|nr:MAG: hypothetical protein DRI90_00275 [Deltaproteobacteria bacterium]